MSMTFNQKGDDDYFIRLLSYLRSQFSEKILEMVPYRKSVILIRTVKNTYMLKGFHTNKRLRLQEAFTSTLRKEGFTKTYLFVQPQLKETLFFEGTYFGCMEYIPPNKIPFSFKSQKNRQEGLELLEQFHQFTSSFESRYRTLIPKGVIIEKWKDRGKMFSSNISFLKYFINDKILAELLDWANWSLSGMEKDRSLFIDEPFCILHGDVAHHNFLRDSKGILHLIDFDLISIGPQSLDYLQYANRILPSLDWSYDRLEHFSQFNELLKEKAFLYALAFPADIFREWNRLIREGSYREQHKYKQVMDLTIGQFSSRKNFIDTLKKMTK
ncbi:phosphotransferase [Neobacillus vireti]|uniref:phosphotransferase n=1 Tax=Neobacillus vireti TaxID=220686 RepID=UPI002FFD6943